MMIDVQVICLPVKRLTPLQQLILKIIKSDSVINLRLEAPLNLCLRAGRLARWSFALTNHTGWWTLATDLSLLLHKWNGLKVAWTPKTWSQVPSLGGPGSFTNAPMLSRIHPVSQQHSSPCLDFKNQSPSISSLELAPVLKDIKVKVFVATLLKSEQKFRWSVSWLQGCTSKQL